MKNKINLITVIVALFSLVIGYAGKVTLAEKIQPRTLKIGFVYNGDASNDYTSNFVKTEDLVKQKYGDNVEIITKYNVPENVAYDAFHELVSQGCDMIFGTSALFAKTGKKVAKEYPQVQICMAAADNANDDPVRENYHSFMGTIYQGRYLTGVAAGMKIQEMIDEGLIKSNEAKVGYVASFPNAEIISGYTAFLLGVRSVVATATMDVEYTKAWANFSLEKNSADELIQDGCVIISQHTDTNGPAVACEDASSEGKNVYHIGYNANASDVAPTTALLSCRVEWEPYIMAAVEATMNGKSIEKAVKKTAMTKGTDAWAGIKEGWVALGDLNEVIAAEGTAEKLEQVQKELENGKLQVFKGSYTGVDPDDKSDTYDLNKGYEENAFSSVPSFHYVLRDVITIL